MKRLVVENSLLSISTGTSDELLVSLVCCRLLFRN